MVMYGVSWLTLMLHNSTKCFVMKYIKTTLSGKSYDDSEFHKTHSDDNQVTYMYGMELKQGINSLRGANTHTLTCAHKQTQYKHTHTHSYMHTLTHAHTHTHTHTLTHTQTHTSTHTHAHTLTQLSNSVSLTLILFHPTRVM